MAKMGTQKKVEIPPKSVATVFFDGNVHNYFRVMNSGDAGVYCGLASMPNKTDYLFMIDSHSTRMYCEDITYRNIFIYNDSASPTNVTIFAFTAPFSTEVMAFCDFYSNMDRQVITAEIGGFTSPLPSGTNNIGEVRLNGEQFQTLSVTKPMNTISYTGQLVNQTAQTFNATSNYIIEEIVCIANDSSDKTLSFRYSNATGGSTVHSFVIKPGEVLNNVKCDITSFKLVGNGTGNVDFRFMYNERRC